ncbi:50S ribosomal protein L3 [archaeon]|jgi:large subunit ribosomal protein L3|nr:50S ribosomal protein L3 [archaeon]MBT6697697.1 50S ribosomal protein L3 [archaeon]
MKAHNPRRGSMQFWPRRRSKHSFVKVRSWATDGAAKKALGLIGFKAGMTHVQVTDNRSKSMTKGEKINIPVTIVECPNMLAYGVALYSRCKTLGLKKVGTVLASEISKEWKKYASRSLVLAKKEVKKLSDYTEYDEARLIVLSAPFATGAGQKKPQVLEIAIGGSKEDQIAYATEVLGKEIAAKDVFEAGAVVDSHAVTKGKGFQGVVKRYGVALVSHKAEKERRHIGVMGGWTPKRVDYRVAQPGGMGSHLRTVYNQQIISIGEDPSVVNREGGFSAYGVLKNNYILVKGSIPGARKSAVLLSAAIRPQKVKNRVFAGAPELRYVSVRRKSEY